MRNAGLDEAQAGITISGRNIQNLRYPDGTTFIAESEEELKREESSDIVIAHAFFYGSLRNIIKDLSHLWSPVGDLDVFSWTWQNFVMEPNGMQKISLLYLHIS